MYYNIYIFKENMMFEQFFSQEVGRTLEWFGLEHITLLLVLVLSSVGIVLFSKKIKAYKHERIIRFVLLGLVVLFEWNVFESRLLNQSIFRIPLCGIALYMLTYSVLTKHKSIFLIGYFYAFGTLLTFLFYDTPYALDRWSGVTYFGAHLMIGVLASYGVSVLEFVPSKKDLLVSMGLLAVYALISGYATFKFGGSDELFLKHPPVDFLVPIQEMSQVLYTLTIVIIAAIMMLGMYGLVYKQNKRQKDGIEM